MPFQFGSKERPARMLCDECGAVIIVFLDDAWTKADIPANAWKNGFTYCPDCVDGIEELPPEAFWDPEEDDEEDE